MIYSMTAFARQVDQGDWGSATWEIRAVNHRYLDCSFKVPESFKSLEMQWRELAREKIQRGRIDCILQYKPSSKEHSSFSIDKNLVQNLAYAINEIKQCIPEAKTVSPLQILSWPNVLQVGEENIEAIQDAVTKLFVKMLDELVVARAREGNALQKILEQKLRDIAEREQKIRVRAPKILQLQQAKIMSRFAEIKAELDPQRLEQEMVLLAQRVDIMEELDRLTTHVKETQHVLREGGRIGKKLDFLLQELNREVNTIASKSIDTETTSFAVELKVFIEQMREQVQNVE
jgi:uncharacterized protein (TIGR00255 family)